MAVFSANCNHLFSMLFSFVYLCSNILKERFLVRLFFVFVLAGSPLQKLAQLPFWASSDEKNCFKSVNDEYGIHAVVGAILLRIRYQRFRLCVY